MVDLCIVFIDFHFPKIMKDRWKYYCGNKIMYVHSLGNCRQFLESMQSFNNIGWHNWSNSHHLHYSDFCWRCFTISTWWQNDAAIFRMHLPVSAIYYQQLPLNRIFLFWITVFLRNFTLLPPAAALTCPNALCVSQLGWAVVANNLLSAASFIKEL